MEVQIIRREEVSHLPTKVLNESKIFLGSHFDGRAPLTGLTKDEEKKYLPQIIGVSANHPEFTTKAREFWATMGFLIPVGGVVLDITVDENGTPYNLEDWIKYKWAKRHKLVAPNKEALENDPRKKFYIHDPEEADRRKHATIQVQKQADIEFIKATQDPAKARRIVRMMNNVVNPDNLTDHQVENQLYDLKNSDPARFLSIAQDKKLDVKAEIQEMIEHQILRKVGNQIIYIDQVVGESMDDAVAWMQNQRNSTIVTDLKAKLKEIKSTR